MTKDPFKWVSHMCYNLDAHMDFLKLFNSKFITCCRFFFGNEILLSCLFTEGKWTNIYIEVWAFKTKYTQNGICGQAVFKNAKDYSFWKLDG